MAEARHEFDLLKATAADPQVSARIVQRVKQQYEEADPDGANGSVVHPP